MFSAFPPQVFTGLPAAQFEIESAADRQHGVANRLGLQALPGHSPQERIPRIDLGRFFIGKASHLVCVGQQN